MTRRLFTGKKKGLIGSVCLIFSVYLLMGFVAGELVTRVDFIGRAANVVFSFSLPALAAVFALREHKSREWLAVLLMASSATALIECFYLSLAYYPRGGFGFTGYLSSLAYLLAVSLSIYLMAFVAGRLLNAGFARLRRSRKTP